MSIRRNMKKTQKKKATKKKRRRQPDEILPFFLERDEAEILTRVFADICQTDDGDDVAFHGGHSVDIDERQLDVVRSMWKHVRKKLGRKPHEWPETEGQIPEWARMQKEPR